MTLNDGTGITNLSVGLPEIRATYSYKGICIEAAPARQTAIDTAKIAFAPNLDFDQPHMFWVPSKASTIILSISDWCVTIMPFRAGAMMSLTFFTALAQPL